MQGLKWERRSACKEDLGVRGGGRLGKGKVERERKRVRKRESGGKEERRRVKGSES